MNCFNVDSPQLAQNDMTSVRHVGNMQFSG